MDKNAKLQTKSLENIKLNMQREINKNVDTMNEKIDSFNNSILEKFEDKLKNSMELSESKFSLTLLTLE